MISPHIGNKRLILCKDITGKAAIETDILKSFGGNQLRKEIFF